MDEQALRFDIAPAEASHLEVLQHTFDPDTLSKEQSFPSHLSSYIAKVVEDQA